MFDIILAFITAFTVTYFAIPSIINVAHKKNLMDVPGGRKNHKTSTPSLGGIGIFAGTLFSIILWTPFEYFGDLQYILCSFIIIFLLGAKDDIDPIAPKTKFLGELFAASIIVFKANVKLSSLYGIFGIYELPDYMSILLSIFVIIVIINAFNLIDGINGLSGGLGTMISVIFGVWFLQVDSIELAMVAFSIAGSLVAFLKFNITPAKIFMGDTGALLLGLVCSILAIKFIELHKVLDDKTLEFKSAPSMAVAILILPLFDTLRVFTIRIFQGKSPFHPDRNHIHHLFVDSGLSHSKSALILVFVNFIFIAIAYILQDLSNLLLLSIILGLAIVSTYILSIVSKKKQKLSS